MLMWVALGVGGSHASGVGVVVGGAHCEGEAGAVCSGAVVALCGEEGQLGFVSARIMTKMVYFPTRP